MILLKFIEGGRFGCPFNEFTEAIKIKIKFDKIIFDGQFLKNPRFIWESLSICQIPSTELNLLDQINFLCKLLRL